MHAQPSKSVVPVFMFFLLLLLGGFVYSSISLIRGLKTYDWPSTRGTVIGATMKKTASKGARQYSPEISYTYVVSETQYTGKKYGLTNARGTSYTIGDLVKDYPEGSEVNVYYNPVKPGEAILHRGLQPDNYYLFLGSGFFFAIVLMAFIKQLKEGKHRQLSGATQ
jgi:hypothetical protein